MQIAREPRAAKSEETRKRKKKRAPAIGDYGSVFLPSTAAPEASSEFNLMSGTLCSCDYYRARDWARLQGIDEATCAWKKSGEGNSGSDGSRLDSGFAERPEHHSAYI